jgi:hypothetical protein
VIVVGQPSSSLRLLQGGLLQGMIPSAFITLKMGVVAGDCWCCKDSKTRSCQYYL